MALRAGTGGTNTAVYLYHDLLGSTIATSVGSGGSQTYWPYGSPHSGSVSTPYQFTSQLLDASDGLYSYGARWHDSAIGRFIQPDTLVPNPANPQTLNRYTYEGAGRVVGDTVALFSAAVEIAGGGGAALGGGGLCITGVGCLVGAPVAGVGAAVAIHGGTTGIFAGNQELGKLSNWLMADSGGSTGRKSMSQLRQEYEEAVRGLRGNADELRAAGWVLECINGFETSGKGDECRK